MEADKQIKTLRHQDNSVGIMTRLRVGQPRKCGSVAGKRMTFF